MDDHNMLASPAGHTLLWDGRPFFNQHLFSVSQRGCVGHSGMKSTPMLIPQAFRGVEGRQLHPLHTQILVVVSDLTSLRGGEICHQ